jgi:hypothetical protein
MDRLNRFPQTGQRDRGIRKTIRSAFFRTTGVDTPAEKFPVPGPSSRPERESGLTFFDDFHGGSRFQIVGTLGDHQFARF